MAAIVELAQTLLCLNLLFLENSVPQFSETLKLFLLHTDKLTDETKRRARREAGGPS